MGQTHLYFCPSATFFFVIYYRWQKVLLSGFQVVTFCCWVRVSGFGVTVTGFMILRERYNTGHFEPTCWLSFTWGLDCVTLIVTKYRNI